MNISCELIAGGSIVNLAPAFSTHGECIFVACKNVIYQYHTKTGQIVYQYKGWESNIVGLHFTLIDNLECLVACSSNGQIIVWKITNRIQIMTTTLPKRNITSFHVISGNLTEGLQVLIAYNSKKNRVVFARVNTKKTEEQIVVLRIPKQAFAVDVSPGRYFTVVSENFLHCFSLKTFTLSSYQMAKNNRQFTCVACHPEEEIVLTGDDTGRVVLWQNIFGKKSQAIYHWHTLPVKTVAFSTLGSYFYSGAAECVLVKWQLNNPDKKQFLPRLPAGILQLAVSDNNAYVAVATADNAVRIVDSQMNEVNLIQHLVVGGQPACDIIYDPITRSLVMNGNVGCIQFYSPKDKTLLYNVDIVGQNKLTDERECQLVNTNVSRIALSQSGTWLGSVEERKDGNVCKELRLKFWFFNSEKRTHELNTSVEFPHESSVNSLLFQPLVVDDGLKCITVSNDKSFKIWQVVQVSTVHRTGPIWRCIGLSTFRDSPCAGLSFSMDGSLFAIGFGKILTIWATENCELKSSLLHSKFKERDIAFVQFGQGNQCHYVAAASQSQLSVWNILTLTMSWVVRLHNVTLMVSEPRTPYMLVVSESKKGCNTMYLFEPSSPSLLYSKSLPLSKGDKILAAVLVPNSYSSDTKLQWNDKTDLYFITSRNELYRLSNAEQSNTEEEQGYVEDLSEEMSVFRKMKAQVHSSDVKRDVRHHLHPKDLSYKSFREYLEAPLETLPPVRLMATSLLQSLVLQRDPTSPNVC